MMGGHMIVSQVNEKVLSQAVHFMYVVLSSVHIYYSTWPELRDGPNVQLSLIRWCLLLLVKHKLIYGGELDSTVYLTVW